MVSARAPFLMCPGWGLVMGVCLKDRLVILSTSWKRCLYIYNLCVAYRVLAIESMLK